MKKQSKSFQVSKAEASGQRDDRMGLEPDAPTPPPTRQLNDTNCWITAPQGMGRKTSRSPGDLMCNQVCKEAHVQVEGQGSSRTLNSTVGGICASVSPEAWEAHWDPTEERPACCISESLIQLTEWAHVSEGDPGSERPWHSLGTYRSVCSGRAPKHGLG